MFENLPDQSGVKYLRTKLEYAMGEEEQARLRLIREGQRLIEDAEKVANGRKYREISTYSPDPLAEYNRLVAKVDAVVETLQAVAWASMTDIDTAQSQSEAFDAWVADCRATAVARLHGK